MKNPFPGARVRGSSSGRPIMALLDLLGRRMALRIIWELRGDPLNFRDLVDAAGTNPSVLNTRLSELREAGIIELSEDGYGLTAEGRTLLADMMPLNAWADAWAKRLRKP